MDLLNPLAPFRAFALFYTRDQFRKDVRLVSTAHPRVFETPEFFLHDPAAVTMEVFHNGRKLTYSSTQTPGDGEFFVTESVVDAGYDRVHLVSFSANDHSVLSANYFIGV